MVFIFHERHPLRTPLNRERSPGQGCSDLMLILSIDKHFCSGNSAQTLLPSWSHACPFPHPCQ